MKFVSNLTWSKFGEALSFLGVFYFVGFFLFGAISLIVLLFRYEEIYQFSGPEAIFSRVFEMIGPLTLLPLFISAAAWYLGRRLTNEPKHSRIDLFVAAALFAATILILTPQLYIAITSLIPAIKG